MSIKSKLIFVLAVVVLLLLLTAGFVWWNVARVARQMDTIGSGIDYLHDAGGIRVNSYRQMHALLRYFSYGEEGALQEFYSLHDDINALLVNLNTTAVRMAPEQAPGPGAKRPDQARIRSIEANYRDIVATVRRAVELKKAGRPAAARGLVFGQIEKDMDDTFFTEIDGTILEKSEELMSAYDEILMRMGALPWTGKADIRRIQGTRYSIRYYLVVDRLSQTLHRELNEIIQYVVAGHALDRQEYNEANADVEQALQECTKIIQTQKQLGMEGEENQLAEVDDLRRGYRQMSGIMERANRLKQSGRDRAAFILAENELKAVADDTVLPKLERILVNSRAEIMLDHRILLRSIYLSGFVSLAVITLTAVVLLLLVQRLIRRMMLAINALASGAEIIGSGNLDHRIDVDSKDELGELAVSFNRMTGALKDTNDDLRSFIYSLSHDLRSPLVNIRGFSEELMEGIRELGPMLERYLEGFPPDERKQYRDVLKKDIPDALTYIGSSVKRMDELINAVLALSRIGHRELKLEFINMDDLVRTTLDTFAHRIMQDRVTVTADRLPDVIADRLVMEQCVMNLLDNALKYLDPSRPGTVLLSGEEAGGETIFRVRDNGRGIAEDDLPKIFGLFRRVGTQDVPGDGLGLAYVKALIRRQGGRIWCESEPGAGTTFSFTVLQLGDHRRAMNEQTRGDLP